MYFDSCDVAGSSTCKRCGYKEPAIEWDRDHKEPVIMNQCSPAEMRKNLEVVEQLRKHGIDFVVIPVKDAEHKKQLIAQGQKVFEELASA